MPQNWSTLTVYVYTFAPAQSQTNIESERNPTTPHVLTGSPILSTCHFHCSPGYFAVVCTDQEPGTVHTDSNQVKFIVIIKIANGDFKDSASRSKGYLRCPLLSRKSRYIGF